MFYCLQFGILTILACFFPQTDSSQSVMERLASTDWLELISVSNELTDTIGLTLIPPQKAYKGIEHKTPSLDINYNKILFKDNDQEQKIIPNIEDILTLSKLVALETASNDHVNFGVERVFEGALQGKAVYLSMLSDGQFRKIVYYSENGEILDVLDINQGYKANLNGRHLAILLREKLQIYELKRTELVPIAAYSTKPIAAFLQAKSDHAQESGAFGCGDFQFEVRKNHFVFWAFNVSTTAFLPGFLHLRFSFESPGSIEAIPFGIATKADRLPVNTGFFSTARINDLFWVPRCHDAQIDIFDLDGKLVGTVALPPLHPNISEAKRLTSATVFNLAVSEPDQASFYRSYQELNFISGIFPVSDFVFIERQNVGNRNCPRIYTVLNKSGGVLAEDFSAARMKLSGFGIESGLFLAPSDSLKRRPPPWLLDSKIHELGKMRKHDGWWLSGLKVNPRAGHQDPEINEQSRSTELATFSPPPMSSRLKASLLKAKQLRNILAFGGFVKLKLPPDQGMKQISDVLFMDGHYIVVDKAGKQVLKFTADGHFVQTISRQGRGPGEFDSPSTLTRAFGGHFALVDRRGVLLFDKTGKFVLRPSGFLANGLTIGLNPVVWDQPDRILFANPFSDDDSYQHFGEVSLYNGKFHSIKGFGKRTFSRKLKRWGWNTFAKVGDKLWTGSPHRAVIELYDLKGNFIKELKGSIHPEGMTLEDHKDFKTSRERSQYQFRNPRWINWGVHPLGPIVIRTVAKKVGKPVYDIFDFEGNLLAKALNSGASAIEILDTYDGHLVGKILGAEYIEFTQERLRKMLYKREYDALFEAGFRLDSEEDAHFLWLAYLR